LCKKCCIHGDQGNLKDTVRIDNSAPFGKGAQQIDFIFRPANMGLLPLLS